MKLSIKKWFTPAYQLEIDIGIWKKHLHYHVFLDIWKYRLHFDIGQRVI